MSQGLLALTSLSCILTDKESSLASVAACASPCHVPGTLHDWVSNAAPQKGSVKCCGGAVATQCV